MTDNIRDKVLATLTFARVKAVSPREDNGRVSESPTLVDPSPVRCATTAFAAIKSAALGTCETDGSLGRWSRADWRFY